MTPRCQGRAATAALLGAAINCPAQHKWSCVCTFAQLPLCLQWEVQWHSSGAAVQLLCAVAQQCYYSGGQQYNSGAASSQLQRW